MASTLVKALVVVDAVVVLIEPDLAITPPQVRTYEPSLRTKVAD